MNNTNKQVTEPKKPAFDLYQTITNTIISHLEEGTAPWHKKWVGGNSTPFSLPINFSTNKHYKGINILLLWSAASKNQFTTNEWATLKQWNEKKEKIRKNEKSSMIVYFDMMEKEIEGEIEKIPFLKYSKVFNRSQLESYIPGPAEPELPLLVERLERVEKFVANTKADIKHQGYDACYIPDQDVIHMPSKSSFINTDEMTATEGYYSTLMHELTHWTGHPKRLDRKLSTKFGSNPYAEEELIAELGAAFLAAALNITNAPKKDHANYIATWLQVLKQNKYAIISAARSASKAVDYLMKLPNN